jgi:type III secretion protein R
MNAYHQLRFKFRFKSWFYFFAILAVIWLPSERLYSATGPTGPAPKAPEILRFTSPSQVKPASPAAAATPAQEPSVNLMAGRPSLVTQSAALALMALMPFIIMVFTSFLKIVVVLSLLRNALGVQQAPPNQIINGVAFMLSLFVMYPTALKIYDRADATMAKLKAPDSLISPDSSAYILAVANDAKEPLRDFIKTNSSVKHQALFYRVAYRTLPEEYKAGLKPDDFMVLMPSYITSQLKDAFEIGVLIYIPFFVIDLVTSNVLLAMGMMMLSPMTISMPLKLFLLVMLDGWTLLIEGLVSTFR